MRARLPKPVPWLIAWLALAAPVGCDRQGERQAVAALEMPPQHIDSIVPIDEEIRRFRATLSDSVASLAGGAASRDELIARFVTALEAGDVAALGQLAITPVEFAYLYYPHTRYTRRPYELSPGLLWFQLENYGSRGLARALARYGGAPLGVVGHACAAEPEVEDRNRVWSGCVVRRIDEHGDTVGLALFGAILERDGAYKFINYGNRL